MMPAGTRCYFVVIALCLLQLSSKIVLAESDAGPETDINIERVLQDVPDVDLLNSFLGADRLIERTAGEQNPAPAAALIGDVDFPDAFAACAGKLTLDRFDQEYIAACLPECMVNWLLDADLYTDDKCAPVALSDQDLDKKVQIQNRRGWGRRVGSWFRRNKTGIRKGLVTAGKIITIIVNAIGKSKSNSGK